MSTSATTRWAPKGKVGPGAAKSTSAESPSSPEAATSSAHDLVTLGVPTTWKRPVRLVELDVVRVGLEQVGGQLRGLLHHLLGGLVDGHPAGLERLGPEGAHAPGHQVGVAVDDLDVLDRDAQLVGHQHRPGRHVALAVRRGAGADPGPAVGQDLDRAELAARDAVGDLDVARQADAELAGVARLAPAPLLLRAAPA